VNLCVSGLLFGVDMPYDIVRQTNDFVTSSLGHFGKAFRLGLVFESVAREIDAFRSILDPVTCTVTKPSTYLTDAHRL
jgi:hypothetical protein